MLLAAFSPGVTPLHDFLELRLVGGDWWVMGEETGLQNGPKLGFFMFFGRFGPLNRPFDLSTEAVALSHQGASIREVRNFCRRAGCRDPELLIWDLGQDNPGV